MLRISKQSINIWSRIMYSVNNKAELLNTNACVMSRRFLIFNSITAWYIFCPCLCLFFELINSSVVDLYELVSFPCSCKYPLVTCFFVAHWTETTHPGSWSRRHSVEIRDNRHFLTLLECIYISIIYNFIKITCWPKYQLSFRMSI